MHIPLLIGPYHTSNNLTRIKRKIYLSDKNDVTALHITWCTCENVVKCRLNIGRVKRRRLDEGQGVLQVSFHKEMLIPAVPKS